METKKSVNPLISELLLLKWARSSLNLGMSPEANGGFDSLSGKIFPKGAHSSLIERSSFKKGHIRFSQSFLPKSVFIRLTIYCSDLNMQAGWPSC